MERWSFPSRFPAGDMVVDIETVSTYGALPESARQELVKRHPKDATEGPETRAALNWATAKVVAIGLHDVTSARTCVLWEDLGGVIRPDHPTVVFEGFTEDGMLRRFWDVIARRRFVSWNGRQFDGPFLMGRSLAHGIMCGRNLVGPRYDLSSSVDIKDVMGVFGAMNMHSLGVVAPALGIETPKQNGIDGGKVAELYAAGRIDLIAEYCARDVMAEAELYRRVRETLLPVMTGKGV